MGLHLVWGDQHSIKDWWEKGAMAFVNQSDLQTSKALMVDSHIHPKWEKGQQRLCNWVAAEPVNEMKIL